MLYNVYGRLETRRSLHVAEKNYEEWLEAFKRRKIHFTPEQQTAELCFTAVQQKSTILQYVSEKIKTAKLCLMAVEQNGMALQFVPEELKTLELCHAAIKQNCKSLEYVPERLREQVREMAGIKESGDE